MKFNLIRKRIHGRGFTLIELMVAVAVIGILVGIALPSYTSYVTRSRRADARTQLIQVGQFMQRFYAANDSYQQDRAGNAVAGQVPAGISISPTQGTKLYDLSIPTASATDYEVRMVPTAGAAMANDECGAFTLTASGVRGVFVSGAVGSTSLRDKCWK